MLWWAVDPLLQFALPGAPETLKIASLGYCPFVIISWFSVPSFFPSSIDHSLFSSDTQWRCAELPFVLSVGSVDSGKTEGNTLHTWSPSITWQPVTIATRKQVCTVSFYSDQRYHLKHFVYVWCSRRTPWPCACQASATAELQSHLNHFSRSTPAVLFTLMCNLCPERFHLVKSNFCPHGNKAFCVIFFLRCCWPAFYCPSLWICLLWDLLRGNHTESFSLCSLCHLTWCPQNSVPLKEVAERPSLLRLSYIPLYCRPCFVHLSKLCDFFLSSGYCRENCQANGFASIFWVHIQKAILEEANLWNHVTVLFLTFGRSIML